MESEPGLVKWKALGVRVRFCTSEVMRENLTRTRNPVCGEILSLLVCLESSRQPKKTERNNNETDGNSKAENHDQFVPGSGAIAERYLFCANSYQLACGE